MDESNKGREQGAGSREQGAGSREQGAGSREQGAGSREQGAGDLEVIPETQNIDCDSGSTHLIPHMRRWGT